eukprot:Rmarinus@m.4060
MNAPAAVSSVGAMDPMEAPDTSPPHAPPAPSSASLGEGSNSPTSDVHPGASVLHQSMGQALHQPSLAQPMPPSIQTLHQPLQQSLQPTMHPGHPLSQHLLHQDSYSQREYLSPDQQSEIALTKKKAFNTSILNIADPALLEKHRQSVEQFAATPCCSYKCNTTIFNKEDLLKLRTDFVALSHNEQDICAMARIQCGLEREHKRRRKGVAESERRNRVNYMLFNRKVCRKTFLFVHDFGKVRLEHLTKHLTEYGLRPRVHGNTGQSKTLQVKKKHEDRAKLVINHFERLLANHGLKKYPMGPAGQKFLLPPNFNVMTLFEKYRDGMKKDFPKDDTSPQAFIQNWVQVASQIACQAPIAPAVPMLPMSQLGPPHTAANGLSRSLDAESRSSQPSLLAQMHRPLQH